VPLRCPECGRFLSNEFVQGLIAEPGPCPRCETVLDADQFHGTAPLIHAPEPLAESVRPPDLPADEVVPPEERDVLAGWDTDEHPERMVAAPLGAAAAIVGAGVIGGLVGGLAARRHRSAGAVIGTLAGATAAIVSSRVFDTPVAPDR
jgi:hypothetical protein